MTNSQVLGACPANLIRVVGGVILSSVLLSMFDPFGSLPWLGAPAHVLLMLTRILQYSLCIVGGVGLICGRCLGFYCVAAAWWVGCFSAIGGWVHPFIPFLGWAFFYGFYDPNEILPSPLRWNTPIPILIINLFVIAAVVGLRKVVESKTKTGLLSASANAWFSLSKRSLRVSLRLLICLTGLAMLLVYTPFVLGLAMECDGVGSRHGDVGFWFVVRRLGAILPVVSFILVSACGLPFRRSTVVIGFAFASSACLLPLAVALLDSPRSFFMIRVIFAVGCLLAAMFWLGYQLAKQQAMASVSTESHFSGMGAGGSA